MKFSSFILIASAAAGLLASCNQVPTVSGPIGRNSNYLPGLNPNQGRQVDPQSAPDNVSYWDGDGVSGTASITIDLSDQKAYFHKSGTVVGVSPISSGSKTHRTPTGRFKVTEKDVDHASSLYGEFEDAAGNVMQKEVDTRKHKPRKGWRYVGAPMKYFLRFNHGIGMHAGILPGYPASHGCIRLPEHMAAKFYQHAKYGTPVIVRQ